MNSVLTERERTATFLNTIRNQTRKTLRSRLGLGRDWEGHKTGFDSRWVGRYFLPYLMAPSVVLPILL